MLTNVMFNIITFVNIITGRKTCLVLCQHTCVLWAGWHLRGRGDLTCVTVCSVMTYVHV